jgi:FMN phosphatase YigB (HAD superfamily)
VTALPASPLAGVRAVSFDLWLTLVRDVDSVAVWTARRDRLAALLAVDAGAATDLLKAAYAAHRAAWADGRALPLAAVADALLHKAGHPPEALRSAVVRVFEEPSQEVGVELLPGAAEAVAALHRAGVPLALVCDTGFTSGAGLRRLLDSTGLLDGFTSLVFSDEIGIPKPFPEPFDAALRALDARPEEVVHVGDLRRKDVAGARRCGLRTARYRGQRDDTDPDYAEADGVRGDHRELLPLLGLPDGA